MTNICLRPQEEADLPIAREIYISHRWEEMAGMTGWDETARHAFLSQQFDFQWLHYSRNYPGARFCIIEAEGQAAGRLYTQQASPERLHIMEIGLLPRFRGQGIGSGLLAALLDQCRRDGAQCTISVEQTNPARRLYERLGFRPTVANGPYIGMEWRDSAAPAARQPKTA